jgi:hypothetical protein
MGLPEVTPPLLPAAMHHDMAAAAAAAAAVKAVVASGSHPPWMTVKNVRRLGLVQAAAATTATMAANYITVAKARQELNAMMATVAGSSSSSNAVDADASDAVMKLQAMHEALRAAARDPLKAIRHRSSSSLLQQGSEQRMAISAARFVTLDQAAAADLAIDLAQLLAAVAGPTSTALQGNSKSQQQQWR